MRFSEDAPASLGPLYAAAFPDEDLAGLAMALVDGGARSFSAYDDDALVGHAVFTPCDVEGEDCALLGPVAVAPGHQRGGVGSALIRRGLDRIRKDGALKALVLGDPNYYARFGFTPEAAVAPPYPIPDEWRDAWASLSLSPRGETLSGVLAVPALWRDPALWGP